MKRSVFYALAIILVIWGTLEWGESGKHEMPAVPLYAAVGPAAAPSARDDVKEKEALAQAAAAHDRAAAEAVAAPEASLSAASAEAAGIPAISTAPALPAPSPSPAPAAAAASKSPSLHAAAAETVNASVYQPGAKPVIIPVLNYHSVAVDPGNIVVISPDKFAEQMDYLDKKGYTPLSLNDFMLMLEHKKEPPAKPVLLTFDDGYTDNVETAMPILQKHHFPATLFMSPGMIGMEGYIDWEQAKTLRDAGWDIQPHGMTHPSLPKLKPDEQTYEITEAKKQINEQLGVKAEVFCYPYGQYNETTLRILSEQGFRYAFTIDQGKTTSSQHPYKLKRIFVNGEEGLSSLVNKLTKW